MPEHAASRRRRRSTKLLSRRRRRRSRRPRRPAARTRVRVDQRVGSPSRAGARNHAARDCAVRGRRPRACDRRRANSSAVIGAAPTVDDVGRARLRVASSQSVRQLPARGAGHEQVVAAPADLQRGDRSPSRRRAALRAAPRPVRAVVRRTQHELVVADDLRPRSCGRPVSAYATCAHRRAARGSSVDDAALDARSTSRSVELCVLVLGPEAHLQQRDAAVGRADGDEVARAALRDARVTVAPSSPGDRRLAGAARRRSSDGSSTRAVRRRPRRRTSGTRRRRSRALRRRGRARRPRGGSAPSEPSARRRPEERPAPRRR